MLALAALASSLKGTCRRLCIGSRLLSRYGGFNEVAVQVMLGRLKVCRGSRLGEPLLDINGFTILSGVGNDECDCFISGDCGDPVGLSITMPKYPQFIIDVSLWRRHTEGELRSLMTQLIQTIREVRRYLWDGNLTISGVDPGFLSILKSALGDMRTRVNLMEVIPSEYLKSAIMLDPYGDIELTEAIVKSTNVFIIGGISDSEVIRRGETYELYRYLELDKYGVPRVKVTLRGVLTGVPERINKIVSILLMVKFSGYNIDDAVIANQSKADKITRLYRELNIMRELNWGSIYDLLIWLGLTPWDSKVASILKRIRVE